MARAGGDPALGIWGDQEPEVAEGIFLMFIVGCWSCPLKLEDLGIQACGS